MENLFLNTFATVKKCSVFDARVRIRTIVWSICRIKLQVDGCTSEELKEAYNIFCECKLQDVYDTGCLEIRGREFNFVKILL